MIRIEFSKPSNQKWLERARDARVKALEDVAVKKKPRWRTRVWKDLKETLLEASGGKCAYCEVKLGANFHPHVEHFRPKSGVTEDGFPIDHPGYYWLAYEWYNLLPACNHCNSDHPSAAPDGHPGKGREFKVMGDRVYEPSSDPSRWQSELDAERPLLLHPYFDDPRERLDFDSKGFYITVDSADQRAIETIKVCDLNRPALVELRNSSAEDLYGRCYELLRQRPHGITRQSEFAAWRLKKIGYIVKEAAEDKRLDDFDLGEDLTADAPQAKRRRGSGEG